MSKVLVSEDNLTNIASSIRNKLEVEDTYKPGEMSAAIDSINTLDINGIIKEYQVAAGENVSAGDFVRFINNQIGTVVDKEISSSTGLTRNTANAVALNSNKVFILLTLRIDDSSIQRYLYGIVCTVDGTTITAGSLTQLNTRYVNIYEAPSPVKLTSTSVFIAYGSHETTSSQEHLWGMICTINDTTITVASDTELNTSGEAGRRVFAVALSSTKVFIAFASTGSTKYLYGVVCTINGTTVTRGTFAYCTVPSASEISVAKLSSTKVFVVYSSIISSKTYLYGVVCTIDGTTVTFGTITELSPRVNLAFNGSTSIVALTSTKVFIVAADPITSTGGGNLYGKVCTVDGTTITAGDDTLIASEIYHENPIILLSASRVFIITNDVNRVMKCSVCTISDTTITIEAVTNLGTLTGAILSAVQLAGPTVFICYTNNSTLWGKLADEVLVGQIGALSDTIVGVAKADGAGNEKIEVYVPSV